MKVNVKKALATMMAAALIVTSAQCPTASAAKKPKLNSKKVTLTVGKKKTLKVKNKIKGSTYTWKSSKVKVAKVTKKGVVKAVKAGTATITCKVKTKATKKKKAKTYTLKCKVTVKKKKTTKPTAKPTAKPTTKPSTKPSDVPSNNPSDTPSQAPSDNPSTAPSTEPSVSPSADPSASPSVSPSVSPSASPTTTPSYNYRPGGSSSKPGTTPKPTETDAPAGSIAKTEAELKDLAAKGTKEITLQPTGDITIEADDNYKEVKLTVNAPNSTITNKAQFASIDIKAIKADTWIEAGLSTVKNIIKVLTASAHVKVEKDSAVKSIEVAPETAPKENETVTITDNSNNASPVTVASATNLKVAGTNTTGVSVNVEITDAAAEGTVSITSSVKVTINTKSTVDVAITLEQTAEGSEISAESAAKDSALSVTNKTNTDIEVRNTTTNEKVLTANKNSTTATTGTVGASTIEKIAQAIKWDNIKGTNEDQKAVTESLNLATTTDALNIPSDVVSGAAVTIKWESSEPTVVSTDGTITTPKEDTEVTLTVTVTDNNSSNTATNTIIITVKGSAAETVTYTATVNISVTTGGAVGTTGSTTGTSIAVEITASDNSSVSATYALTDDANSKPAANSFTASPLKIDTTEPSGTKHLWVKIGEKYYSAQINFTSGTQENIVLEETTLS